MIESSWGGTSSENLAILRRYYLKFPRAFELSFRFIEFSRADLGYSTTGLFAFTCTVYFPHIYCTCNYDNAMPEEMKEEIFLKDIPF